MHHRKNFLLIMVCALISPMACGRESTTPAGGEDVVLLAEDMSTFDPADEGGEDQNPSPADLASMTCSEGEVKIRQDIDIGGELLAAGCYSVCESSQDCQAPTPRCYDSLSRPICVPDNIPLPGPECGDGVVEGNEACDGDCLTDATTCPAPRDSCMQAVLEGLARTCDVVCGETPVVACQDDDGCCPGGCGAEDDTDCVVEQVATGVSCANDRDCTGDAAFRGQRCFSDWLWMDGYCTAICERDEDCGGDGVCLEAGEGSYCYDRCEGSSDCREGYSCQSVGIGSFCGPVAGQGATKAGGACQTHAQCGQGEYCQPHDAGFPDGFCSRPCRATTDCGAGTSCVAESVPENQTPSGFCSPRCGQDSECRDGYVCLATGTCWPKANGAAGIGEACKSRTDCAGGAIGFCADDGYGFPGGYCSHQCQRDEECGQGTHCSNQACMPSCVVDEDCPRSGYVCADSDADGRRECFPGGDGPGEVGAACRDVSDCSGGFGARCINALGDAPEWTAGYCMSDCSPASPCPTGAHCGSVTSGEQPSLCFQSCQGSMDCRDGYSCLDRDQDGVRECAPRPSLF